MYVSPDLGEPVLPPDEVEWLRYSTRCLALRAYHPIIGLDNLPTKLTVVPLVFWWRLIRVLRQQIRHRSGCRAKSH
jgi:hypothetical protein